MTIEEIRKYAEEKGFPKKGLADMCKRLEADYKDGNIDDMEAMQLCTYIDIQAECWKHVIKFIDANRHERTKRREERARKAEN